MEISNIHRIQLGDREIILLGTAHISQESISQVQESIRSERPDRVCVELDAGRLKALTEPDRWKSLDLKTIIRQGQLSTLVANLMLSSYQKRMGQQTGVRPGQELLVAVETAEELGIPFDLVDREVKTTLKRAWRLTPWYRRFTLLGTLLGSLFDRSEVTEAQLREIKQQDTLSAMMEEFGKSFPELKQVVITERDHFLAGRIFAAQGKRVLAVIGAGHLAGIAKLLETGEQPQSEEVLTHIPKPSSAGKIIGWGIPLIIVGGLVAIGFQKGLGAVGDSVVYWILMTGLPAAAGTALALPHPLTILTAFVMAPFTTLHPLLGVSTFTALAQALLMPPRVHEMESVGDDITKFAMWWRNRLLRIFLCFLLPGLPTTIGMVIGGIHIFKSVSP